MHIYTLRLNKIKSAVDEDMTPDEQMHIRRRKGQKPDLLSRSLLHLAAEGGRIELLKCLLVPGGKVNLRDKRGFTPLHSAAVGGNTRCVRVLAYRGVELDTLDYSGSTALDRAFKSGNTACAVWLLCLGASPGTEKGPQKEHSATGKVLRVVKNVLDSSPDAMRDADIRATLMRKAFAWSSLNRVCKNVTDALQSSTGLPPEILDSIVGTYVSEFSEAAPRKEFLTLDYDSSSDESSSPEKSK